MSDSNCKEGRKEDEGRKVKGRKEDEGGREDEGGNVGGKMKEDEKR
jgi:hypothetical protein